MLTEKEAVCFNIFIESTKSTIKKKYKSHLNKTLHVIRHNTSGRKHQTWWYVQNIQNIYSPPSGPFKPIWQESSGRTASCFHSCRLWRWLWRQERPRWVWPRCSGMGEEGVWERAAVSERRAAPRPRRLTFTLKAIILLLGDIFGQGASSASLCFERKKRSEAS